MELDIADPGIRQLQERLNLVDLSSGYGALLVSLKRALATPPGTQPVWKRLAEIERVTGLANKPISYEREGDPDVQELQKLRDLRTSLIELQKSVEKPRYQRCLLVAGDAGAGKTHITTTLRSESPPAYIPNFLLLWLQGDEDGDSIEAKIESELRRITDYPWQSLKTFQRYLDRVGIELKIQENDESGPPALAVILDDYERWLRKGALKQSNLQNLILETTKHRSIYWVLLVQHAALADVVPGNDTWQMLAWHPEETAGVPTIGPWIDLDTVDRSCQLGLELIRKVTEREDARPMNLQVESGSPNERDLSNPRISWTFLDCRRELGIEAETLAGLNFIDFVNRFWESRKSRLETAPLQRGSLDRLVQEATAAMIRLGFEPPYEDLACEIAEHAKAPRSELVDVDKTKIGIQILENAGFWRTIEKDSTPYIQLRNEFFWSHRIAQELLKSSLAQQEQVLATFLDTELPADTNRYLREAIAEFFLLLADGAASGKVDQERVLNLWQQALGAPTTATAGWLGAVKASRETQKAMAECVRDWKPTKDNPRALFAFLYFLGESLEEILSAAERISAVQPLYGAIASAGYRDYCFHVLAKAFDRTVTREELLAAVEPLAGVEVLKHSEEVGYLIARTVARVCEKNLEKILSWLLDYAKQESRRIASLKWSEETQPAPGDRIDGKYFLRQWIFFCVLDLLLASDHQLCAANLFERLKAVSWYAPEKLKINPRRSVGRDMEIQADMVLGYGYRRERGEDQERYQGVIENLVGSAKAQDRKVAYFLIRHTRPTGGQSGLRYSSVFEPVLRDLFLDRDLEVCRVVDRFYDDFRVNLGDDFQALEEARNAFHTRRSPREGKSNLRKVAR